MQKEFLDRLKENFFAYVQTFYTKTDGFLDNNIRLKECHTKRVCAEMVALAEALALNGNDALLAETIGLLHDAGRFEQFTKYRTYKDTLSENHCLLGLRVIAEQRWLAELPSDEQALIRNAVEVHGAKELPPLDEPTLHFAKMIRDTDKLDIYMLCTENYRRYHQDKKAFPFEVEFIDSPEVNPAIVDSILNRQTVDYRLLKTLPDAKLLQLGWVFDVYFDWTLRQMRDRGYIDGIARWLPDTQPAQNALRHIMAYVAARLDNAPR